MANIIHHEIEVKKTAHFYTLGNDISRSKHVWFVFHGYGQLASSIIRKFDQFNLDDHFVISLEGFSRFYWNIEQGTIGSSWMTSRDRLFEINDYLKMIDQVYSLFLPDIAGKKIYALAFSQGTSTAWRWISSTRPELNAFIQWAGSYPPELDYKSMYDYLKERTLFFVYGNKDPYLNQENMQNIESFIRKKLPFTKILQFNGKHIIDRKILKTLVLDCI